MRWRAAGLVGLGGAGVVLLSVADTAVSAAAYFPLCALGLVAMVVGVHRNRPPSPVGWWCVIAAHALWLVADAVHVGSLVLHGPSEVTPAAPLYVVAYLPLGAGLVLMARSEGTGPRRAALLEGAVVSVALSLLSAVLVIGPALQADGPVPPRVLGALFIAGDVVMVTLVVHLLATAARRSRSHLLGAAATVVLLVADSCSTVLVGDSLLGPLLAMGMLISNALWGAAALALRTAPAAATAPEVPAVRSTTLSARRVVVLVLALALPTALMAVLAQRSGPVVSGGVEWSAWTVAAAGLLMSVLVVLRMVVAIGAERASLRAREQLRRALEHQATHDPLTGLSNRTHSRERLEGALAAARGSGATVAVIFVDLDGFKAVNDTFGHRTGDAVLRAAAARLTSCARGTDVVGRLGGDEFVVVLADVDDEAAAAEVAGRLLGRLCAPVDVEGGVVDVGASIGVATTRAGAAGADALIHEADTAAYRAKAAGRGRVVVYDAAVRRELDERAAVEAELRAAILAGQLELHHQPVVDLVVGAGGSGRDVAVVGGMEALVRWRHPQRGLLGPAAFVPVAEASDLVCDLGRWVLRTAALQQAAWARLDPAGRGPIVGVNLAPRHLAQPTVVAEVAAAVTEAGVAPGRLLVEVTETEVVDSAEALENLRRIRALGVLVAIDDFGTGWTSISQLQHLPCDVLKVDRGLVVSTAPGAAELLALVVSAGHAFGMSVVAEGVETEAQRAAAVAAGADCAQGWLWCPALPASEHDALVASGAELTTLLAARLPVA